MAEDLDGFSAALRAGRSGVRVTGDEMAAEARTPVAAWPAEPDLTGWAARRLAGDTEAAARLVRAVSRTAPPARGAARVAAAALHDAGLGPQERAAAGLIVAGNNLALAYQAEVWRGFISRPGGVRPSHALTHLDTDVIGAVSEATGVVGEGWQAGGASAAGTLAVILAARMIAAGDLDRCLVVAPVTELSAAELRAFHATGAMVSHADPERPWQACRPFDRHRQGFVYGKGAAAVLLEEAGAAAARGAKPLALVAGYGQRLDGRRGTRPDPAGQVAALRAALAAAGVDPGEVDYVNAHGTGSVVGDAVEAQALLSVFGAGPAPLINSTKPLTGHCMGASGLLELVATVLQMRDGFVHPNPNLAEPLDPELPLAGRSATPATIRTAVSNSVAFSGINCALVLRSPG
ncbi:polyketide biosynthesis malonyl-ACP decarboxylase PksF [Sphaerisporangium rufum]|uniref:Polyketide biosynthesis malonyl-ACP decarboxylase PksF n=1 Tax=Sphaerisporangium rufum TaxID=1381558 RepID=A0A919V2S4_9ACTN|nr:polyketide biosynthesis malonyl-ACP decarboxylase PksF [Sphaerisporangium rufum]